MTIDLGRTYTCDNLHSEGMAHDLVRLIQSIRKDMNLNRKDSIHVEIYCNKNRKNMFWDYRDFIRNKIYAAYFELREVPSEEGIKICIHKEIK